MTPVIDSPDCFAGGPSGTGYIPSASNCTEYLQCADGQVVDSLTCSPPGHVWDPDSGRCDDPSFVTCATIFQGMNI